MVPRRGNDAQHLRRVFVENRGRGVCPNMARMRQQQMLADVAL
jgi:hypothetical protein